MGYYNEKGQLMIDKVAAEEDIQKISEAIKRLADSEESLSRIEALAANLDGSAGPAITGQAGSLKLQVSDFKDKLKAAADYIQNTIDKYEEEERRRSGK